MRLPFGMILVFVSPRFALMAGFFQVLVQFSFGFPSALAYGPNLLGGRVSPVF